MNRFDKRDIANCENLIKAVKKAKFELDGMEVLALAELFKWINGLYNRIQAEANQVESKPQPPPQKEQVPPVSEPVKQVKKPKKD